MSHTPDPQGGSSLERLRTWLRSDVTITAPGWAVALGGALALVLLLAALD
mgnify:CR=1 FL=1